MEKHYTPAEARRHITDTWPEKMGQPTGKPELRIADNGELVVADDAGWCQEVVNGYATYRYELVRTERGRPLPGELRVVPRKDERGAERHDLTVLHNLLALLSRAAGMWVPAAEDLGEAGGTSGGARRRRRPDTEMEKYVLPLRQPRHQGEVAELAARLGQHLSFWESVHRQLNQHYGERVDSRQPLNSLVHSLRNYPPTHRNRFHRTDGDQR